ncbi:Endo-1,4-beta-xylanase A precursor [compost metagenome]
MAPAYFFGDVDLTVKRTGLKVEGKLDYSAKADAEDKDKLPMLTKALLEAQWVTPWFVRVESEMDIGGWNIIVGKAGIFVGQNLEKNRTDFEGYIGAKIQIPEDVPVVGGLPLYSVFLGVNNDKVWGSIGVLLISLGITYYWGGGVEFGTSTDQLPDGLIQLVVDDPELGPRLMVIGQGIETLATSEAAAEQENQEIIYRELEKDVQYIENGSVNISVGGITVKNSGRVHEIPMDGVTGNALIEMEYDTKEMPEFTLKDAGGKVFPVKFDNTNTDPTANAFQQYIPADNNPDKVDIRKAYIIVPADQAKSGGNWTLTAVSAVKTKLLNVPTAPQLNEINLAKDSTDVNKFNASWKVANAAEGDTVNLYLTEDAVTKNETVLDNGAKVLEAGDPGLLIAKDVPVGRNGGVNGGITSGSTSIDVTNATLMGKQEDIRGLLRQGNYYLRAELKSTATFATKTSAQKFELIDPMAPQNVSDVKVEPAGNGLFALSFKPGAKKPGHANYEHSYVIDAQREQGGVMSDYSNFGEILFTESELAPYWNAASGKYEGILIGGWSATSTSDEINLGSLEGTVMDLKDVKYVGLEVGYEYEIGVSAATVPTADDDQNQNYHYAERVSSSKQLLPKPVKPVLTVGGSGKVENTGNYINLLTNQTEQSITLSSDQKNVSVEAFNAGQSIGKVNLTNSESGSQGKLDFSQFKTDGPYAIELRATNTVTKDISVTMLYLTVDTLAPVLYIDSPGTGARTAGGKIAVSGTTTKGTLLKAGGTVVPVAEDGTFNSEVPITSGDPTVALEFTATDGAGNENSAVVDITNDSYDVPAALILEKVPSLQPGETSTLNAFLKVARGKDENGKLKFEQVPVKDSDLGRLAYTVPSGDSVEVVTTQAKDQPPVTTVTALSTGASLIEAEYTITEGVALKGYTVASVEVPEPTSLGTLSITAQSISGDNMHTKMAVHDAGDMTGQQLAYMVYESSGQAVLPKLGDQIGNWSLLPASGVLPAKRGDVIVIAKRTSLDKLAMAAAIVPASVWNSSDGAYGGVGGGGGNGGGGVLPAPDKAPKFKIGDKDIEAAWEGTTAILHLKDGDLDMTGSGDIVISSKEAAAAGFSVTVDQNVVQHAVTAKKKITVDVPLGRLTLAPENLKGLSEPLKISIGSNAAADKDAMNAAAAAQKFTVLGGGQGATVSVNLAAGKWTPALAGKIAIPAGIAGKDITAVVLKNSAGQWTTIPWKLDSSGTAVNVQLTGEGSLFFISNAKAFKDVSKGFWAEQNISDASGKLFVLGTSADSFAPQAKVTRAELPTILLRVAGLMNNTAAKKDFKDVAESSWYFRSVSIAADLGIVTGFSEGTYAPKSTLTRMEAMTMVGRLLNVVSSGGESIGDAEATQILSAFADKDEIPAWAKSSIALSIKTGIIRGVNGKINPAGALTRAEAATMANRLDEFITGKQ